MQSRRKLHLTLKVRFNEWHKVLLSKRLTKSVEEAEASRPTKHVKKPLLWLALLHALALMVILCAASCITSAPQPVFSTNVVMIAVPMPPAPPGLPAIQPQLIPHIVVTETIAGHPVPLVTGNTNAARTNIVLSFTSPGYRRLAYQNSPGQFAACG